MVDTMDRHPSVGNVKPLVVDTGLDSVRSELFRYVKLVLEWSSRCNRQSPEAAGGEFPDSDMEMPSLGPESHP